MRDFIVFRVLLPLSNECMNRPRGGSAAWYLQMFCHNVLGNPTNLRTGMPIKRKETA